MTPDRIARRVRAMTRAAAAGEVTAPIAERLRADLFALSIRADWEARQGVYGAAGIALPELPAVPNVDQIRRLRHVPFAQRIADVYLRLAGEAAELAEREAHRQAREIIADSLEIGGGGPRAAIARMGRELDWAAGYASMIERTASTGAAAAGQIDAARDPDVKRLLPALRYEATRDSDVRRGRKQDSGENHLALHGLVAPADWPGWRMWAPPLGFSCRCSLRLVHRREIDSLRQPDGSPVVVRPDGSVVPGEVPSAAMAHPDFRGPKPLDRF